jgi:predicted nucleic acid-binding protein
MMNTQSLNQILGVSHKEPEVQKVRRSLTITRINSNFSQMLVPDAALIRREKDPADKRVFLYYVAREHAEMLIHGDASGH